MPNCVAHYRIVVLPRARDVNQPTMNADRKTKPSADETNPNGSPMYRLKRVGRWVSVIRTSISPRTASISCRRVTVAPPLLAVPITKVAGVEPVSH